MNQPADKIVGSGFVRDAEMVFAGVSCVSTLIRARGKLLNHNTVESFVPRSQCNALWVSHLLRRFELPASTEQIGYKRKELTLINYIL